MSHPSWVCGLKLQREEIADFGMCVTPFVGVWIETRMMQRRNSLPLCHTLRGCVD